MPGEPVTADEISPQHQYGGSVDLGVAPEYNKWTPEELRLAQVSPLVAGRTKIQGGGGEPVSANDIVQPQQEGFWQELFRRRQQEIEQAQQFPKEKSKIFRKPVQGIEDILSWITSPFAQTGIGPFFETVGSRYIRPGAETITTELEPPFLRGTKPGKFLSELGGRTADIAFQTFAPGPIFGSLAELATRPSVLARLKQGEELAKEAGTAGKAATEIKEAAIPRADEAGAALEKKGLETARALRRGEAELEQVPGKISPKVLTPYEVGAEYGGKTIQPKPRLEELGVYGRLAKQSSDYFKKLYDAVRGDVKDIRVPVESLNEIKMGIFEGLSRSTAQYQPVEYQTVFDIMNQKSTPQQVAAAQKAMEAAEKAGKPFGPADLAAAASEAAGKTINGSQLLDRVHILRNQARASSNDLVEFLRNDLAQKYMDLLGEATTQAGKPEVMNELNRINSEYRTTREVFGKGAIPRELAAGQYASDILQSMFGPGKAGSVERARVMREILPKEQFDSYVRAFHQTMFDPQNMKESIKTWKEWKRNLPEFVDALYGKEHGAEMDRIITGFEKDQKKLGLIKEAGPAIEAHGKDLARQAKQLEKVQKDLLANAAKLGYRIEPQSEIEKLARSRPVRYGALGFGSIFGFEHLGLALANLAQGNKAAAAFQGIKGLLYMSPLLLSSISTKATGAKAVADIMNADSVRQAIPAIMAVRAYLAQQGTDPETEISKLGLTYGK